MGNKFIVVEGLDGAGKTTQMSLLQKHLTQQGKAYEYIHFPMLNQGVYGSLVAEFLRGEFGTLNEVHPKLVALLYGCDRHEHVETINQWMDEGKYVLADRYVNSNIAYQCAKLKSESEKLRLRDWIFEFEFGHLELPRPALSIFLDVPFSFTEKSLTKVREGEDRDYLKGASDIHEDSLLLQKNVRFEYHEMLRRQDDFFKINCTDEKEQLFAPDKIHKKIVALLVEKGVL